MSISQRLEFPVRRDNGHLASDSVSALQRLTDLVLLLAMGLLWLGSTLALLSYQPADAAFSTSGAGTLTANWLGWRGAWLADLLYVLFGFSAWWLVLALARWWLVRLAWFLGAERKEVLSNTKRLSFTWHLKFAGLPLLLISSCALEWSRIYRWEVLLPGHAGGVLGWTAGAFSQQWLGFNGAGIVWICLFLLALPLVLHFSWLRMADGLGTWIDGGRQWIGQAIEANEDERLGEAALRERARVFMEQAGQVRDTQMRSAEPELGLKDKSSPGAAQGSKSKVEPRLPVLTDELPWLDTVPGGLDAQGTALDSQAVAATQEASSASDSLAVTHAAQATGQADRKLASDSPQAALSGPTQHQPAAAQVGQVQQAEPLSSAATSTATTIEDEEIGGINLEHVAAESRRTLLIDPPVLEIPASRRAQKESQVSLFGDAPGDLPRLDLLDSVAARPETVSVDTLEMTSRLIEKKLADFGVQVRVVAAQPGPVITRYEIEPATGVKGSQIVNLSKDLARSLSLVSIRVVETIPGKNLMALELPNARRQTIRLMEILGSAVYAGSSSNLTLALGKDIVGHPVVADLAKMPHCLVAGTTGSGKSVGINGMILSLLYKSEARDVRLILIDPKMLEMSIYEGIPHLLCPVVTDMKQAGNALNWCVGEMERRYRLLSKLGVRNLAGYNKKIDEAKARGEHVSNPLSLTPEAPEPLDRLPQIVIFIDELADLMMVVGKKIEELIARLAQKARAAGIHLILATQRPSVDVITGLIKANIPTRLSFQVSSKVDSRTILDQMGAEALLGMGDMLYMPSGMGVPQRVHGAFVSDDEVHRVVEYLKSQGEPNYVEGILEGGTLEEEEAGEKSSAGTSGGDAESDPLYDKAVAVVLENRKASISLVQRHLRIGYNRAARMVEQMQKSGLVSAMATNGSREIISPRSDE